MQSCKAEKQLKPCSCSDSGRSTSVRQDQSALNGYKWPLQIISIPSNLINLIQYTDYTCLLMSANTTLLDFVNLYSNTFYLSLSVLLLLLFLSLWGSDHRDLPDRFEEFRRRPSDHLRVPTLSDQADLLGLPNERQNKKIFIYDVRESDWDRIWCAFLWNTKSKPWKPTSRTASAARSVAREALRQTAKSLNVSEKTKL